MEDRDFDWFDIQSESIPPLIDNDPGWKERVAHMFDNFNPYVERVADSGRSSFSLTKMFNDERIWNFIDLIAAPIYRDCGQNGIFCSTTDPKKACCSGFSCVQDNDGERRCAAN